jgi:hypothetical protein
MAGAAHFERARGLVRRGALGVTYGVGGIGGVDHGAEEHAVGFVLSADNLVFRAVAAGGLGGVTEEDLGGVEVLRVGVAVQDSGHGAQIVHGDPAAGAGAERVVGGGMLALAYSGAARAVLSVFGAGCGGVHVDAKARWYARWGLCA